MYSDWSKSCSHARQQETYHPLHRVAKGFSLQWITITGITGNVILALGPKMELDTHHAGCFTNT